MRGPAVPRQWSLSRRGRCRGRNADFVAGQPYQFGARSVFHLWVRGLSRGPGVTGAAVATTTGRSIGVLYQLYTLAGGRSRITVARRDLRLDWPVLRGLLRIAWTGMIQYFISTASWISLTRINAAFGSTAVAGYTLAFRVILFAILPSWGISSAAATLVGQNLGAGNAARAGRSVWLAGLYNMGFLTLVGVVFFAFAQSIVAVFTNDPFIARIAVTCLRYVSLGYPLYAWGMVQYVLT